MKLPYLIIFIISSISVYLLTPKEVFTTEFSFLAIIFIFTTSISITCIIRHIRETIKESLRLKSSILSTIAAIFGIITLQACGLSAPVCGATAGTAIVATFFPGIVMKVYQGWGNLFLLSAIFFQIIGLYFMKCYKLKIIQKKN